MTSLRNLVNVLPLDDRRQELFNPNVAGRPDLMFGRTSLTLYEGMTGMLENDFINTKKLNEKHARLMANGVPSKALSSSFC